jgi:hypothetical protein
VSWVPFHDALRRGAKRGLSRSARFIYLELSLEARPYHGRLPLPFGFKSVVAAVHDVLGGSRREVAEAIEVLTQTDAEGLPMIAIEGQTGRQTLVVCAFDRWVREDKSAARTRRWRNKQTPEDQPDTSSGDASRDVTVTTGDAESVTPCDGPREEKRREEKIEESRFGVLEVEVFEHWISGWRRFVGGVRIPKLDAKRRGKIRARLREGYSVEDLKLALDGLWSSSWHLENRKHDIELVCRDAPHVDEFIARASARADSHEPESPRTAPDEGPVVPMPAKVAAGVS